MEEERFVELFDEKRNQNTTYMTYCYGILDERQISADDVELLEKKTTQFLSDLGNTKATVSQPEYLTVFEQYRSKERRVTVTLAILQVPVVVLLLAFIFMISGQMLSMEQNEISILKSRGAGRNQIILLYLMQAVLLNIISFIAALPLGALLCQMLGSANAFLEFVRRRSLSITISARVLGYGAGAMALSVLVTVLPVLRYSKVSIVNLKQGRSRSGKALWQKLYADIVLLGISLYGLYTFSIQKDELAVKVLSGAALDPMLYLSSSLFILGSGLFVLRLWPWILKGIYRVGQKRWKPETYAAFLQMIRNGRKQQFMMIFLVLTVALGIFNATVARTILSNGEDNLRYQLGADVVLSQEWKDNQGEIMAGMADSIAYTEPDSDQFTSVSGVEYMARVLKDTVQVHGQEAQGIEAELMAITTNEFGMVVYDDGANAYSLVQYLNVLSTNSRAVLVSENFKSMYGYQLGDEISYGDLSGTIYGFFTYFPSYVPTQTVTWSDSNVTKQDCFMIVANLSYVQSQWGVTPYELWFKMEDGDAEPLMDYIEENGINVEAFDSRQNQNYTLHNDPLFQGTNGVLTMSFIVILLLCGVGFLIYWILSIRERELLFGVLRAMGLSGKGVIRMLLTEQLLGSILFIASGVGIGIGASVLYVPLIALAYMAQTQTLPLKLVIQPGDLVRLLVLIGLMLVVCMTVLIRLVFDMKITNALKLGED
jgi:putative ABC transport system permease protein